MSDAQREVIASPPDDGLSAELRIALLSDVHGNLTALTAVADALVTEEPLDDIVVAGDLLQGGPRPREVWEFLIANEWTLIRGNEDESLQLDPQWTYVGSDRYRNAFLAGTAWTRSQIGDEILTRLVALPDRWRRVTPAGDLLVVHASPRSIVDQAGGVHNSMVDVTEAYAGTGAQVIAFGHYHRAFVRTTPFALLINVASVGLPRDGRAVACYTIVTSSRDGWVVEQRQVPYDPDEEARIAAERGMPSWTADASP
ncbi:MAG TPA: metallophosphoesterase family protein [Chloroflexota bacterium]|nr:metallophosphoesterase family protein [Chloroflexota bacterium]